MVEPGQARVALGSVSTAGGTPLNDRLQEWKEMKEDFEKKYYLLDVAKKEGGDLTGGTFEQQQEALNAEYSARNFNFAETNQNNVVGKFVSSLAGSAFPGEQTKAVKTTGGVP